MEQLEFLSRLRTLKSHYDSGLIPQLHKHEVNPGLPLNDRLNYLYFTLPVSLNFQRSSPAMWQAALKTYEDPETNYLFYPEKVAETPYEKVQKDLLKHKLSLQPNKHTQIWTAISKTLYEHYDSDPRNVIKEGQNCVVRIKNILQITKKKQFPYISGEKMANYWLYILYNFTDIKLRNLHKITIIPDTHVIQCSVKLGIANEKHTPVDIANTWNKLLKGSEYIPIDFHPILWNWSRAGFNPEV
jgi:hypothetical protein